MWLVTVILCYRGSHGERRVGLFFTLSVSLSAVVTETLRTHGRVCVCVCEIVLTMPGKGLKGLGGDREVGALGLCTLSRN